MTRAKTNDPAMRDCGVIFDYYDTDKNKFHSYGPAYDSILTHEFRRSARNVMEVGIADGRGLLSWREIFPGAMCVGLDKEPCNCERGPRLEFHVGDQGDRGACLRAVADRQFDFICEDASHVLANNLLTLFYLWPFIRPGGYYVIEEMQDVTQYRDNVEQLFYGARLLDTVGPVGGGNEPLVILHKSGGKRK